MKENKMGTGKVSALMWTMGLPMVLSMILQAVYNVVDTAFVINCGPEGATMNLALTAAFPIQILMIALGVGTGIGINALLSRQLGEKNLEAAKKTVGTGIFLALVIYLLFLIFGLAFAKMYMNAVAPNEAAASYGTEYLRICCCFSFGSVGYTVYERYLQAAGHTGYSMIAQISGALANILLDWVFIYPCGMGVAGAAWATIIGQILSLLVAMAFHYFANKEIPNSLKALIPDFKVVGIIYSIGWSAMLMQALLSLNMLGVQLIMNKCGGSNAELLTGSFGIYYKIQQMALFAIFGLSNTIISLLGYNYGAGDKERQKQCVLWGIFDCVLMGAIIAILFEALATPIAQLFGLASGSSDTSIIDTSKMAIRLGAIGYVFMGFSLGVQGVLQAYKYSLMPLLSALGRLVIFCFPFVYLFLLTSNPTTYVWWSFPIAEALGAILSLVLLIIGLKKKGIALFAKKAE